MITLRHRRTTTRPLVVLVVLFTGVLALAGCRPGASGSAAATGSVAYRLTVGGVQRTYRLYRPASVTGGERVPLVVFLHGGFGSARQAERAYGWDAAADAAGFVVAYPDGLGRAWNAGGGCCGASGRTGVDDVAFVRATVAAVARQVPVDPDRVYATGISNGGMMAYRLACDTELFAAVAPDAATVLGDCPRPAPVSVLHLHGSADTRVRLDGAPGEGVAHVDGHPVDDVLAHWRTVDRCHAPATRTQAAVTTSTAACADGRVVELVTIDGAGHQWPGAASRPVLERVLGLDPPSPSLDATTTVWRFFAAHPKPAATV